MKLHRRYLGCMNWPGDNQMRSFEIPRNYALVGLEFELVADLTRTTGGTAGGPKDSAPAQLITSLDLIANGSDTIKHTDFETLHRKNEIQFGVRPRIYSAGWIGYANAAAEVMKVAARMSFAMPRSMRQPDTLLDTAAMSSLDLAVTWGAGVNTMDDTWNGEATPAVTVNDAKLHITAIEYIGVPAGTVFALWKESWLRKEVTADNNQFQIKLPYGAGMNYRSILIKTHSNGNQVDTIIPYNGLATLNKITLKSGTEIFLYEVAQLLQVQNRLAHGLQVPERMTAALAPIDHCLQELVLEGYYYIDFCRDGRLKEMLDTSFLSDLELIIEVANPGAADFIDVYFDQLFLPPKKSA